MDNIEYDTLVCEAVRFYMKYIIEESRYKDDLTNLQILSTQLIWLPLSRLLLYTRYSFVVKNLIEERKYMEKFRLELIFCSYKRLVEMRDEEEFYTFFLSEKVISFKDRLLNLLSFLSLEREKKERFVE